MGRASIPDRRSSTMKHNAPTKIAYVIDTSILIDRPSVIFELEGTVILPRTVIRQLDKLKNSGDRYKTLQARKASSIIDSLTDENPASDSVQISDTSVLKIVNKYVPIEDLVSAADNKIVGTAIIFNKEMRGAEKVILLTTDKNMRVAARTYGIEATDMIPCKTQVKTIPLQITPEEALNTVHKGIEKTLIAFAGIAGAFIGMGIISFFLKLIGN